MVGISPRRTNFAQSALVFAATLSAVLLLAAVLAYWTWVWLAPRSAPRVRAADEVQLRVDAAYSLFGGARRSAAAPAALAIKVLGVVAASGGKTGYAIL